jgi:PTH1 family peptidyl-tRNA hydrolase
VLLAEPQTYMNRSGYTARCLVERRGFEPGEILVVFDEVNLPLGRLRLRPRGSPGGHRGMESILDSLASSEVPRLRLGVGGDPPPAAEELVDFVLSQFTADERPQAAEMIETAVEACESWLAEGMQTTMNRFNRS